jgi:predicted cupin superfamily sugar epimerase
MGEKSKPLRDSAYWIENLALIRHPEGGYYRETYRSPFEIKMSSLPDGFDGPRSSSTAVYYLLDRGDVSVFHRLRSDEMWHFYDGHALLIHVLDEREGHSLIKLGRALEEGEALQALVPAGRWFGAELAESDQWALVGCTVSPGFDFKDFEMARRERLLESFPAHRDLVERLTR